MSHPEWCLPSATPASPEQTAVSPTSRLHPFQSPARTGSFRATSAEIVNLSLAEDLRTPTPSYLVSAVAAKFLNSFLKDRLS